MATEEKTRGMGDPIVRLVSRPGYLQANTYRVRGTQGCILVDPGAGLQVDTILAALADEGLAPPDIHAVLLTHYHCDHALAAPWFCDRAIPIVASAHTADILARGDARVWGEHPELVRPCPVDRIAADGQCLEWPGLRIRAMATPGHTQGCMTFLVQQGDGISALTGDLLMPDGHPGWAGDEFSRAALLQSLREVVEARPILAFPGHGSVDGDVREWLTRGIDLGRAGHWRVVSDWQAEVVPPAMRNAHG
jgi:glyoxylase-like metal-dependent hydrolase (beta-lactamase superfamily II)